MPTERDDRLARVYERGDALRRRRLAMRGGAAAVLAVMLLVGAVQAGRDREGSVVAGPSEATTTTSTSTTIAAETTTTTAPAEATTTTIAAVTTTVAPPAPTTTVAPCRNSYEGRCGPFRFDPQPVNRPMEISIAVAPTSPKAGEPVTFTITVADDGAAYSGWCINEYDFGDGSTSPLCDLSCSLEKARFGPWDPPPPDNSRITDTLEHTYDGAGTYTFEVRYNAKNCRPKEYYPYFDVNVSGTTTVTVG